MSIPGAANPLLLTTAAAGGYNVERSLRFNSSDSAYLSRTPASAGNRKTWTWAGWVKRGALGSSQYLLEARSSDTARGIIRFTSSDQLAVEEHSTVWRNTTQVFRDASAWYHLVVTFDTTQSTGSDRVKIYVNGSQVTTFSSSTDPTQNADYTINSNVFHALAASNYGGTPQTFFSGYLADVHFIDGQALDPTSFTEVSATTGQLIPKAYTGSFGTNGFWLKFSDNSAATATTLGKDYSGNSNNWTPNNLSVTAGAGNDSLTDTPTSYGTDTGAGGEVRGNYATLNPLAAGTTTLSNGNLDVVTNNGHTHVRGTIGVTSGKWYWEVTPTGGSTAEADIGIVNASASLSEFIGQNVNGWGYYATGNKYNGSGAVSYANSYTLNDVIGVALDADAGTLTFYKNGTTQGQAFSGLTSGPYFPAVSDGGSSNSVNFSVNFGQRPFAYTAPSGFKALCDTNLPAPVVAKPSTVMDVLLWTGNGSSPRTLSGLGFEPDLVWLKSRSISGSSHILNDQVRGANKRLSSDSTAAEDPNSLFGYLSAFTSTGFTVTSGSSGPDLVNKTNDTYVAWTWDAGSSTVSNTQGSITSQVRANASAGFSIVTYTGNGSASATVGHGLGVAPAFWIIRARDVVATKNWPTYHTSLGSSKALLLNTTSAVITDSYASSSVAPTSSVVTVKTDGSGWDNVNTANYVMYAWTPVAGYSSFGSYTGNGSATDGPFVYTGFRPRWVMLKQSSGSGTGWQIHDTSRNTYNVMNNRLQPNNSDAESTYTTSDFLSNGFKLRDSDPSWNSNGATYIYAAFAENPFAYARAR